MTNSVIKETLLSDALKQQQEIFSKYNAFLTRKELSELTGIAEATIKKRTAPKAKNPLLIDSVRRGKCKMFVKSSVINFLFKT